MLIIIMAHDRHLANVCAMNIQVEDGWNEGLLESLCVKTRPIASKRIQSLQNSFLNKLPSANRQPPLMLLYSFLPLFVLLLLLPWLFTGNIPRKTSRDQLPLCFRSADRVCVLLTAAVLQPLGTEGGTEAPKNWNGSLTEGETHEG